MLQEKRKLLIHRLIWLAILVVVIVVPIVIKNAFIKELNLVSFLPPEIFIAFIFIRSLLLSCNVYEYNGNDIIVYAGWYHHYIKINQQIKDELNTGVIYSPITLSCTLEDGTVISATITYTNRISLKINNQLYTNTK